MMPEAASPKSAMCHLCGGPAKYTCPGCLVRSCSLPCVSRHKADTQCTGHRQKIKYKPLSEMDDLDLLNDYRLLEGIGREIEAVSRAAPRLRHNPHNGAPQLRPHQHRLRRAARRRGVRLDYLPEGFQRRQENTSRWRKDGDAGCMVWRVEWRLPLADAVRVDEGVADTERLCDALGRLLGPAGPPEDEDRLQHYRAAQEARQLRLFFKVERVQQGNRYMELSPTRTLQACLRDRLVIEFPILVVTTESHAHVYRDDVIEESYFSLCKQDQEEKRRTRRAERRRRQPDGAAAEQDDDGARKVPRPCLDAVPVVSDVRKRSSAAVMAAATEPAPLAERRSVTEVNQRPDAVQPEAGPYFVGGTPVVQDLEEMDADGMMVSSQVKKASAGFGLFGANDDDDDADLSD